MNLQTLSLQFAILKAAKEQKEREIELLNTEMARIGKELSDLFADNDTQSIRLAGRGFTDGQDRIVTPDNAYKTSIVDQPVFYKLLRDTGHGDMIRETVHHATLEKWVKEQKEQNAQLPPESVLKIWTVEGAKVRRAPKSAK